MIVAKLYKMRDDLERNKLAVRGQVLIVAGELNKCLVFLSHINNLSLSKSDDFTSAFFSLHWITPMRWERKLSGAVNALHRFEARDMSMFLPS